MQFRSGRLVVMVERTGDDDGYLVRVDGCVQDAISGAVLWEGDSWLPSDSTDRELAAYVLEESSHDVPEIVEKAETRLEFLVH